MRITAAVLAVLALAGSGSLVAADPHMEARSDRYQVEWGGISLGEGTISLAPDTDGCYRYESTTKPIALVRWTYGSPREKSRFCVRDGQVVPQYFEYVNDKRSKDDFRLDFDWTDREVKMLRGGELVARELPDGGYDRLVIRQAVRLWVLNYVHGNAEREAEFIMVDDDRIKAYRFAIGEKESVKTAQGMIEALRVNRIDDRRPHHYWLDPQRDYVPVKIEQFKDGKVELRMVLVP